MEKSVTISIQGLQAYDGDTDNIELITEGTLTEDENGLCLSYHETELTGMEGTTTHFHIIGTQVTLLRTGTVNSEMIFEKGKRHMSLYDTPFGSMEIGVTARKMDLGLTFEHCGHLDIDYDIEINHMLASQSKFHIRVQDDHAPVKS